MSDVPPALRRLLSPSLSLAELADGLAPLTEKERKALAPAVRKQDLSFKHPDHEVLLALGCLGGPRQVASKLEFTLATREVEPYAVRVLRDRAPHWVADLPGALADARCWRVARALVREGLAPRPETPEYAIGMVGGLSISWGRGGYFEALGELRADPALLDDEVWTLLATEGAGSMLHGLDAGLESPAPHAAVQTPRPHFAWRHALVTLAADGTIDRGRLLDTVLAAFLRDWAPMELTWFAATHDALAPTPDEVRARQDVYRRVLATAYGPAVRLAQRALGALPDVDAEPLLDASRAVLLRDDKGTVVAHLALLASLAKRRPDLDVAGVAAVALEHPNAEVRERAARLAGAAPAPVVAAREEAAYVPPAPPPVVPVGDVEELAELFARLLEEASDPVDVERVLEASVRLPAARLKHADVLARRAEQRRAELSGEWEGTEVRVDLAFLALAWLGRVRVGRALPRVRSWLGMSHVDLSLGAVGSRRIHEAAHAAREGAHALLSLPSLADGTLRADDLNARLAALPRAAKPHRLDAGVAALRVPPEEYDAVRVPLGSRTGAYVRERLAVLRAYDPAWVRDDMLTWRDTRARGGSDDDAVSSVLERRERLYVSDWEYATRIEQAMALSTLLLPHHPELLAAHAHGRLGRGLTKNGAGSAPALDALARSRRRTGPVACSALVLGMAARNAGERTRAVDAVVDLARAGHLDGAALGRAVVESFGFDAVVPSRIAESLAEAGRASRVAAAEVLAASCAVLPALGGRRDAHRFVEVTADLATALGRTVALPADLDALARGRSTTVLAKACRRVPR